MINPLDSMCPTCLAPIAGPCRGVALVGRGQVCEPHRARFNKARRQIFKLLPEEEPVESPEPTTAPSDDTNTTGSEPVAQLKLERTVGTERDVIGDLQSKLAEGELLIALRCPCGFTMGLGIPAGTFAESEARGLAIGALTQLVPTLTDHLEQLAARLKRIEAIPVAKRGPGFPTRAELIASYHNQPCPHRAAVPMEQEAGPEAAETKTVGSGADIPPSNEV